MRANSFAAGILVVAAAVIPALNTARSAESKPAETAHAATTKAAVANTWTPQDQKQDQQKVPEAQQPLKVQTTVVNVFTTVRDKHHGIVSDLNKDDFRILEDGQEQKVAFFSKEMNLPITLGLLIDTSGSMSRIIGAEQDAASRFVKEVMRPKDLAMVITFDFDVDLMADFTEDTEVLERAIRRTRINSVGGGGVVTPGTVPSGQSGGTNMYDAVYLACHDQLSTEAGRKAVILLSDMEDTGSKLKMEDAIESAQRADAVIHVLLLSDTGFYFGSALGYGGPAVARRMAEQTGGRVIEVHNEKTLEKAFDEISEELRSQYVLGYYPTNLKHDGTFRKITVQVDRPDMKILARKGYYAPY
jgi:VWFA-related protein